MDPYTATVGAVGQITGFFDSLIYTDQEKDMVSLENRRVDLGFAQADAAEAVAQTKARAQLLTGAQAQRSKQTMVIGGVAAAALVVGGAVVLWA